LLGADISNQNPEKKILFYVMEYNKKEKIRKPKK